MELGANRRMVTFTPIDDEPAPVEPEKQNAALDVLRELGGDVTDADPDFREGRKVIAARRRERQDA